MTRLRSLSRLRLIRTGDGSDLVMRHQDIAAELNRSISVVARSLEELARRGYIARGRDRSGRSCPARIRVTERARPGQAASRDR
jgi:DNA-binding MarR family transcriptional regulator